MSEIWMQYEMVGGPMDSIPVRLPPGVSRLRFPVEENAEVATPQWGEALRCLRSDVHGEYATICEHVPRPHYGVMEWLCAAEEKCGWMGVKELENV